VIDHNGRFRWLSRLDRMRGLMLESRHDSGPTSGSGRGPGGVRHRGDRATEDDAALVARARAIHDRVITLDTHVDINPRDFSLERANYAQRLETQVNLPKMQDGGLDAAFFIVYVGQGSLTQEGYDRAYQQAIEKFDAIHRLTREIAPTRIGLAMTADEVRKVAASGRKVALIGIENAYPLGTDLGRVKEFHDRGGRYMSLAHNGNSQFADSNTSEHDGTMHRGLSALGRQVIAEMNKWGIMVDVSHPSKAARLRCDSGSRPSARIARRRSGSDANRRTHRSWPRMISNERDRS
jgi:hypothetical protein